MRRDREMGREVKKLGGYRPDRHHISGAEIPVAYRSAEIVIVATPVARPVRKSPWYKGILSFS